MTKTNLSIVAAGLAGVTLVAVYLLSALWNPMTAGTIIVADGTQPIAAPVYVAFAKGYFKEQGLDVQLVSFPTGKLCLDALIGGKADFATVAETPVMHAAFKDQAVRIVTTMHRSRGNTFCVARKDLGITTGADLKGKTVAVPIGTNAEYAFAALLPKFGLLSTDLNVINLSPPEMIGPLTRGDVAAVACWQPHIGRCEKMLDDNALRVSFDEVYEETYNIVTTSAVLTDKRNSVINVLKALDRSISYMSQNQDDAIAIVAERLGMEQGELRQIWPIYGFGLDLRQSLLDILRLEGKWAVERGHQSGQLPEMRAMIDADPLRSFKPGAVEIP